MKSFTAKVFFHSNYPYIASTLIGIVGILANPDNPIKGFVLYSYQFLISFLVILYFS
jgi:hypothetical protein